jgi:hypothetical protein
MVRRLALALCVVAAPAFAQPVTMVYQGTLNGLGGDPVTATVPMTFSIFGAATGGSALWTETVSADVQNGFFSVVLGETTALQESFFPPSAPNDRFLSVTIGGDELLPRQPLGSAPWALVCGDAQTVGGMPAASLGDITSVTSPNGTLIGGGASGAVTLDVDYSVMGSCPDPTNDKVVSIDPATGAVQCMPDLLGPGVVGDITSVNPGIGMAGGGLSGDVTLDLAVPVAAINGGTGLFGSGGCTDTFLRSDCLGGWQENNLFGGDLQPGSLDFSRWSSNGCGPGQVPKFDGFNWVCGSAAAVQQTVQGFFGTLTGSGVDTLMFSTFVAFPADGMALLLTEANFSAADADKWLDCHLAEDGVSLNHYYWDPGDIDGWYDLTQSHTESKPVTAGGHTYELWCNWISSGSVSDVGYGYPQITVAFFPSSL